MKKMLQSVLLYSYMHIPIYNVLCSNLVNYEHLRGKLLLNNENPTSSTCKVLSAIRNSCGSGQKQDKINMQKGKIKWRPDVITNAEASRKCIVILSSALKW